MRVLSMSTFLALFSSAKAFSSAGSKLSSFGVRAATARQMSTGPMPYDEEKMPFYALGVNIATQIGVQGSFKTLLSDEEMDIMLEAFNNQMRGQDAQDPRTILGTYGPALNQILQERTSNILDLVKKSGEEFVANFLECNEDAVQTESGLVYVPMTDGEGTQPTVENTVEVHYHGTLTDGTVFDSSVERGQTISFPLGQVIKGWQEGLSMMKEGGKATLVIPSDLGYGDAGSGDTIPPGATLIFEVELFKVS
mmetsp:Transcript_22951/g.32116  ORF Transcript_22951/g.32116 Transcript_22951/m.32116 type:complete len:252 (+) Transcript_22951:193-948(+)